MRVLVIGGLGFVGSSICQKISELPNTKLAVIDNLSKGRTEYLGNANYLFSKTDILDKKSLEEFFFSYKPEIVIHLAALHFIPDCNRDPSNCLLINVVGTENILNLCKRIDSIKKVIITSSQAIYPINDNPNKENDIPDPYDVYGESKFINEFQARRFYQETKIETVVVRLSNVYGPRETNPHVIPEIMEQILAGKESISLGNIEPKRDFIYTSDVADAMITMAFWEDSIGFQIVNLGSGTEYSIREILGKISIILKKNINYEKDLTRYRNIERNHLLADISLIKNIFGWYPKVSIDDGLSMLLKWYGIL